jgi:dinuclear metal center YbgI/SA1388 family protein
MKCSEIISLLGKLAPESCACDWDNPGLLAGRMEKEVKKIYIALDATDEVVQAAIGSGADMLLTHHPLIFQAIKKVNDQNFITRRLVKLIQADISYYAMHTNFDAAPGCMADLAAERLEMTQCVPLDPMGEMEINGEQIPYGVGKTGLLKEEMTVRELTQKVKESFGLPFVLVYGQELLDRRIGKISVCPGAGGSEVEGALLSGSGALVTGDISHHTGIDAAAREMAVIDAGHYGLEHIFISYMSGFLKEKLGEKIEIEEAKPAWPAVLF